MGWHGGRVYLRAGLLLGGVRLVAGFVLAAWIVGIWIGRGFGRSSEKRSAVFAATLPIVGVQIFATSLLLAILGLGRRR